MELKQQKSGQEEPFWQSFEAVAALDDHTAESSGMDIKKRMMNLYLTDNALYVLLDLYVPAYMHPFCDISTNFRYVFGFRPVQSISWRQFCRT